MSTESTTASIPVRDQIDDRHKWNLTDLYKSDETWEADFNKVQELISEAPSFVGKLADSPQTLFACLEAKTEVSKIASRLFQYSALNRDLDSRVSKYQAMVTRSQMLSAQAGAAFSFVEPELLALPDEALLKLSYQFPKTDLYDFYIRELIRARQHVRSEEVEELLSLSQVVAKGPDTIFSMLDDADLTYPTVTDEKGNNVKLTKQRFAKLLESSDPRVRRETSNAFYSVYKDHLNTISATLATEVNKNIFYTKARKYESCLHRALDGDNIPVSVYHSLINATEANLAGMHKWTGVRKRLLKVEEIAPYDMLCPLFPEVDYDVPYDQAVTEVVGAVKPLGEKYNRDLQTAFGSRWVDVYETAGKTGGAYSWGSFSAHPFVLMNYNETVDNMFTLGHEMGHALHSHLSNNTQPYQKAQYSTFVAEVASTLNEALMVQHLLKKASTKQEKLYLLNRQIDNTFGTFFHQVMYAHFELEIHQRVEKGEALSPDLLCEIWGDLTKRYYGPALTLDEYSPLKWSRIPHFYMTFYVYQYATSYAASQAIMKKILDGEPGIIERYLELLKSGGKDYPINLLRQCGIDMATPAPVEATIKLFADQVDEVDRLTRE